jgi:hypothetical protein
MRDQEVNSEMQTRNASRPIENLLAEMAQSVNIAYTVSTDCSFRKFDDPL